MKPDLHQNSHKSDCHHCEATKHGNDAPPQAPSSSAKYYCPMCAGVESEKPGDCPKCGMRLERNPAYLKTKPKVWTCPMHPEVRQDHPGQCPKCGMDLEPESGSGNEDEELKDIRDLKRKTIVAALLTIPVLFLAFDSMIPGLSFGAILSPKVQGWLELLLATPVILWAGGMFFSRGWHSIINRSLNMFTLIMLGVGAAYAYSVVAVVFPGLFPFRGGSGHHNANFARSVESRVCSTSRPRPPTA